MHNISENIKNLFVNHKIASSLIELGFNEPCIAVVFPDNEISIGLPEFVKIMLRKDSTCIPCPTYQQITDWFINEHLMFVNVVCITWLHEFRGEVTDDSIDIKTEIVNDYHIAYTHAIEQAIQSIKI